MFSIKEKNGIWGHMQIPLQRWNSNCEQERFFCSIWRKQEGKKNNLETLTQSSFHGILFFSFSVTDNHLAGNHGEHLISIPSPPALVSQQAGMHSPPPRRASVREFSGTYESLPARSVQVSLNITAIANRNVLLCVFSTCITQKHKPLF